ncbi:MAG: hypothetical protein WEC33_00565, partial [Dehalococcoidia bacterium]
MLAGIEQEYYVRGPDGEVDFRDLIHSLRLPGLRIDPGDSNAYRCFAGFAITADETEAEVATPPVAVEPGFAVELERWNQAGRGAIERRLPRGLTLAGASTHINVSVPEGLEPEVVVALVRTLAPALMLTWEPREAVGLFVRPRPGRVEFCG